MVQRPDKYLIELKGDYLNTLIVSDGNTVTALRPDKKLYTRAKAPSQIIRADLIGDVDMPSPGARIITQLLAGMAREGAIGQILLNGNVTGPEKLGKWRVYVLSISYGEEQEARIYVGADDYMIRQIAVAKGEETTWLEEHDLADAARPIAPETFARAIPDDAKQVASLPSLDKPVEAVAKNDSEQTGNSRPSDSASGASVARGLSVFQGNGCAACHRVAGRGGRMGPDLSAIGASRARQKLIQYVTNPRALNSNARMPAFGGRISDADLQALGDYLASLR